MENDNEILLPRLEKYNFDIWKGALESMLRSNGCLGLLNGTRPRPIGNSKMDKVQQLVWDQEDRYVRGVIVSSTWHICPEVILQHATTSKAVFDEICHQVKQENWLDSLFLDSFVKLKWKKGMNFLKFYIKLKMAKVKYEAIHGCKLDEKLIINKILQELPNDMSKFRQYWRNQFMKYPTIYTLNKLAKEILSYEESRKKNRINKSIGQNK